MTLDEAHGDDEEMEAEEEVKKNVEEVEDPTVPSNNMGK